MKLELGKNYSVNIWGSKAFSMEFHIEGDNVSTCKLNIDKLSYEYLMMTKKDFIAMLKELFAEYNLKILPLEEF